VSTLSRLRIVVLCCVFLLPLLDGYTSAFSYRGPPLSHH
jgi:hypothetical protein